VTERRYELKAQQQPKKNKEKKENKKLERQKGGV